MSNPVSQLSIIRKFFTRYLSGRPSLVPEHFMSTDYGVVEFRKKPNSTFLYLISPRPNTIWASIMPILDWQAGKLTIANHSTQEASIREILNDDLDDLYLILKYGPEIKDQSILDLIEYQAKNPTDEGFNYVTDLT